MMLHDEKLFALYTRLLFVLLFVCFAAAIIGDSTTEALLLSHCDAKLLPRMFLVNAVALFAVSALVMSIIDRLDRGTLFFTAAFGHAAVLVLARVAIACGAAWVYLPLFTYAYLTKIVLFLLFWMLANDLVDSRRAQKRFPLIAAGGTLGAIVMAFAIPGMMKLFAAENLLLVWSACTAVTAALVLLLRRKAGRAFRPSSDAERHRPAGMRTLLSDISALKGDPLLSSMAWLYAALFFVLIVQHYFFYVQVQAHFRTAQRIASFLGLFSGISMAATFVLQVTAAGRFLRRFGSSRSLIFLPAVLLCVFAAQSLMGLAAPQAAPLVFYAIIIGVGLRIAFFDSFFSPNFQLFFSSLPREMRGRAKIALEGAVKPLAILCAGLWLMAVAGRLPLAGQFLICTLLAAGMVVVAVRLKGKYARNLTRFLTGMPSLAGASILTKNKGDRAFMDQIRLILAGGEPELQRYCIEQLASSPLPEFITVLKEHARTAEPRVRASIVTALGGESAAEHRDFIISFLDDPDGRVVANAVMETGAFIDTAVHEKLKALLGHESGRVRANAAIMLWRSGLCPDLREIFDFLKAMLYGPAAADSASALYALGEIAHEETLALIREFTASAALQSRISDESVFRQLVKALGKKGTQAALGSILELAADAYRWQSREIVTALRTMIEQERTSEPFIRHIGQTGLAGRNVIAKALADSSVVLSKDQAAVVREMVHEEVREAELDRKALDLLRMVRYVQGIELLRCAIREESLDRRIDTVVNALSMFDREGSIRKVIARLSHADPHIRARALEVLDTAGDVALNRSVIRMVDAKEEVAKAAEAPATEIGAVRNELRAMIERYRKTTNAWIRRCAENAEKEVNGRIG